MECRDSVTFRKLTAWITSFVNIVIGDTNDSGMVLSREPQKIQLNMLKIGLVVTLEEKLNKILSSASEL